MQTQVENQLYLGRQSSYQTGFYLRAITIMTRVLNCHNRNEPSMAALRSVFQSVLDDHDVKNIILYARFSPVPGQGGQDGKTIPSIERQIAFLRLLIPDNITPTCVRDIYTFASTGHFILAIREAVQATTGKTLVVSTSFESVIRKAEFLHGLTEVLSPDHMVMTCVWDTGASLNGLSIGSASTERAKMRQLSSLDLLRVKLLWHE